jgi:Coenzyme PQQ synthesis protein D (PqqD)
MESMERFELNSAEIVAEVIGGEAVIINLASGIYYSLDGAGGLAWAMLAAGHPRAAVAEAIASRYGIPGEQAATELSALIADLESENLMQPADSNGANPADVPEDALPPADSAYAAPRLQRFEDMGELLAVDPPMPQVAQSPWQPPQA